MYAIAFDMECAQLQKHFTSVPTAYAKIKSIMQDHGFEWRQGSLYIIESDDMARLMKVIHVLSQQQWFASSVRDIRAFRVEQWSDFTGLVHAMQPSTP